MNMEFMTRNYINTTGIVTVNTGTTSIGFLFDRTKKRFAASFATVTAATLTMNIVLNRSISRIVMQNMNFKHFSLTYNTSNSFTLTNQDTSSSAWTGNSTTSRYMTFATLTVNTLTIIVSSNTSATIPSHSIENLWAVDKLHTFDRNPTAQGLKQKDNRKEFIHKLAGGGTTQYVLDDFYEAKIKIDYIPPTERDSFRTIYDRNDAVTFAPFGTGTGWSPADIYEVIWQGDFNFIQRQDNDIGAGFMGSMNLLETGK